jgi:hypothetical protein
MRQIPGAGDGLGPLNVRCCRGVSNVPVNKIVSTFVGDTVNAGVSGLVVAQHLCKGSSCNLDLLRHRDQAGSNPGLPEAGGLEAVRKVAAPTPSPRPQPPVSGPGDSSSSWMPAAGYFDLAPTVS